MPDISIRPAGAPELGRAASMRGAMAREMGSDWDLRHPGWEARFAEFWRDKQAAGAAQCFFAECAGAVAGMVLVSIADEYRGAAFGEPRGYVNGMYVVPEMRRQGVGRALMLAAIEWARRRNCVNVRLRASDDGRPLYASLGFKTGTEMELSL